MHSKQWVLATHDWIERPIQVEEECVEALQRLRGTGSSGRDNRCSHTSQAVSHQRGPATLCQSSLGAR